MVTHRQFCTLTDFRYLAQALALYESLRKHSTESFTLYVLALDDEAASILASMTLPGVQMVLGFHQSHPGMKEAKTNRTHQEYAWTCASNLCEALMLTGLKEITYLDADLMLFSSPEIVFDEIGDKSIAIIPHRFAEKDRARLEPNGLFNVSWVTFRNSAIGLHCLTTWARQCREWCYYVNEGGRFGDQKYLDAWPLVYRGDVCQIANIGAGVAPWNLQQYQVAEGPTVNGVPVIFMHFHEFKDNNDGTYRSTNWPLRNEDKQFLYAPYIRAVESAKFKIHRAIEKERAHA